MNAANLPAIVISQAEEIAQLRAENERLVAEIARLTSKPDEPAEHESSPPATGPDYG